MLIEFDLTISDIKCYIMKYYFLLETHIIKIFIYIDNIKSMMKIRQTKIIKINIRKISRKLIPE